MQVTCTINNMPYSADVPTATTLLQALRDYWHLTGSKEGCGSGECGACTVLLNGDAVDSCLILAAEVDGQSLVTIEGLLAPDGTLDLLQQAFITHGAAQCGYCIPGFIVAARALLARQPHPTFEDVRVGVSGNLCRCTGYAKIFQAILAAADQPRATV